MKIEVNDAQTMTCVEFSDSFDAPCDCIKSNMSSPELMNEPTFLFYSLAEEPNEKKESFQNINMLNMKTHECIYDECQHLFKDKVQVLMNPLEKDVYHDIEEGKNYEKLQSSCNEESYDDTSVPNITHEQLPKDQIKNMILMKSDEDDLFEDVESLDVGEENERLQSAHNDDFDGDIWEKIAKAGFQESEEDLNQDIGKLALDEEQDSLCLPDFDGDVCMYVHNEKFQKYMIGQTKDDMHLDTGTPEVYDHADNIQHNTIKDTECTTFDEDQNETVLPMEGNLSCGNSSM